MARNRPSTRTRARNGRPGIPAAGPAGRRRARPPASRRATVGRRAKPAWPGQRVGDVGGDGEAASSSDGQEGERRAVEDLDARKSRVTGSSPSPADWRHRDDSAAGALRQQVSFIHHRQDDDGPVALGAAAGYGQRAVSHRLDRVSRSAREPGGSGEDAAATWSRATAPGSAHVAPDKGNGFGGVADRTRTLSRSASRPLTRSCTGHDDPGGPS